MIIIISAPDQVTPARDSLLVAITRSSYFRPIRKDVNLIRLACQTRDSDKLCSPCWICTNCYLVRTTPFCTMPPVVITLSLPLSSARFELTFHKVTPFEYRRMQAFLRCHIKSELITHIRASLLFLEPGSVRHFERELLIGEPSSGVPGYCLYFNRCFAFCKDFSFNVLYF